MGFLETAATELATNSPYAFIIIAMMWFFQKQNKAALEQVTSMYTSSLQEIREAHKQAFKEVRSFANQR